MLYHVTVLSEGAQTVFVEPADRLRAVRRLAEFLDRRCLWMCLADTHFHTVVEALPEKIGFLRRDLRAVLRTLAGAAFQAAHAKPITEQRHLEACWRYVVSNRERHGVAGGIADDGSGLADVLGARRLAGFDITRWAAHLPRRTVGDLARDLGLLAGIVQPATSEEIRALGAIHLARVAAGAVGWPDLRGLADAQAAGRGAAMRLGLECGLDRMDLAFALGVGRQATYVLEARHDAELEEVVRRRVMFDAKIRR